jgi:membrane-associated phospholipid phosphatase
VRASDGLFWDCMWSNSDRARGQPLPPQSPDQLPSLIASRINQRIGAAAAICGLLLFGAMAWPVVHGEAIAFDLPVRAAIHHRAFPALTAFLRLATMLGSEYFLVPLAAILVWRLENRGQRRDAYLLVAGSLSAQALSQLLKILIHRPRPEVFFGLTPAETYSFPSGHSFVPAVYFGILVGVLAPRTPWRAAVVGLAALLGFSRVYLGYHYPSDVVAGWALAVVWLGVGQAIYLPTSRPRSSHLLGHPE